MADEYEGMSDAEALAAIAKEWGCPADSEEAMVRLLMARGVMDETGEMHFEDGTVGRL